MTDDSHVKALVKKLRTKGDWPEDEYLIDLMCQAADALEQQEVEVARLTAAYEHITTAVDIFTRREEERLREEA